MTKKRRRIIFGLAGFIALTVAAWSLLPSRLSALFPRATAKAGEIVMSPKTMSFGVDAVGVLRATSVQNFGGPSPFYNYWQFRTQLLLLRDDHA